MKLIFLNNFLSYCTHDSLLDNTEETDLTEEEAKEAWARYESETAAKQVKDFIKVLKCF